MGSIPAAHVYPTLERLTWSWTIGKKTAAFPSKKRQQNERKAIARAATQARRGLRRLNIRDSLEDDAEVDEEDEHEWEDGVANSKTKEPVVKWHGWSCDLAFRGK